MITGITYAKNMGNRTASVSGRNGHLFLNEKRWKNIPREERRFILYHEAAHVSIPTTNEMEADTWAYYQFISRGGDPRHALGALCRVLPQNPENKARIQNILKLSKMAKTYNIEGNTAGSGTTPETAAVKEAMSAAGLDWEALKADYLKKIKKNPLNAIPVLSTFNALSSIFKKGSAWSKMAGSEKESFINEAIKGSFEASNEVASPKEIFIQLIATVGENNYDTFISKNSDWIPGRIAAAEKSYNRKWIDINGGAGQYLKGITPPSSSPLAEIKTTSYNWAALVFILIAAALFVYSFFRKK